MSTTVGAVSVRSGATRATTLALFDRWQDNVYAYGDTKEDDEMLSLADRKFFRWSERGV